MSWRSRLTIPTRSGAAAMLGLGVLLVACSPAGSSPSAAGSSTAASAAASAEMSHEASATASAPATGDASVLLAETDLGSILTDADGLTIYYFANDTEGVSNCAGECLANWPAVSASGSPSAGEGVDAELGTITRDDGTSQLTVNGFPAYYYAGDAAAGDTTGQGVGEVWWVFGADGEPIES